VNNREIQTLRQRIRLVEAAAQPSPRMQRHRDDEVGPVEKCGTVRADQRGERRGERPTSVVLERVNDRAE
jgi:hypothetical protein